MSTKPGAAYLNGRDAPSQLGDEMVGGWPRAQLEAMDRRFTAAVERAIARGKEHPHGHEGASLHRPPDRSPA